MSVLNPMKRNATEFPRKAAICQKRVIVSLEEGPIVVLIVKLPKYKPTTATAINPDTPSDEARAYVSIDN